MILSHIDQDRNMARFYQLVIAPDLFGGSALNPRWGRIGTMGHHRRMWLGSIAEAEAARVIWQEKKRELTETNLPFSLPENTQVDF